MKLLAIKTLLFAVLNIFFNLWCSGAQAQTTALVNGQMLSKTQLLEDYDLLYSSLINYHPRPFAYTTEADFKQHYEQQRAAFADSLSEREFYVRCKELVAMLKYGYPLLPQVGSTTDDVLEAVLQILK